MVERSKDYIVLAWHGLYRYLLILHVFTFTELHISLQMCEYFVFVFSEFLLHEFTIKLARLVLCYYILGKY